MKSILVPTDFSNNAFTALKYAVRLAAKLECKIEVFHAFSMPPTGDAVMVNIMEILEKNAREELGLLRKRVETEIPVAAGLSIKYKAYHGRVVNVINRLCHGDNHDLVVMGTQGETDFSDKWLGTNASDASKNVKQPIIILPADTEIPDVPDFLFATDLKLQKNDAPLAFISNLTKELGSKVKFVHIKNKKIDPEDEKRYKAELDRWFGEGRMPVMYIENSDIEEGITKAIRENQPDILIIVRRNYSFLDSIFRTSVSQKLIRTAALPILVLQS